MKFSERMGLQPVKLELQVDSINPALRNRLWNVLQIEYWRYRAGYSLFDPVNYELRDLCRKLWNKHFKAPIDQIPTSPAPAIGQLRIFFFECKWFEVYDFIEFILNATPGGNRTFSESCNRVFEEELSGYRFVAGKIVPISSKQDVAAIEDAITQSATLFPTATQHLQAAISLLSKKPNPDYRNTIKESISAVEALCGALTGDSHATLGQTLKALDVPVHPALRLAFEKLYGYTSDADGIRHALMEGPNLRQEDALFMLVACSAFISYVTAKYARKNRPGC